MQRWPDCRRRAKCGLVERHCAFAVISAPRTSTFGGEQTVRSAIAHAGHRLAGRGASSASCRDVPPEARNLPASATLSADWCSPCSVLLRTSQSLPTLRSVAFWRLGRFVIRLVTIGNLHPLTRHHLRSAYNDSMPCKDERIRVRRAIEMNLKLRSLPFVICMKCAYRL